MSVDLFYRHYATALLTWQSVESALFTVFVTMLEEPNLKRMAAIYYSQETFSGKLRVVDAVAKVTFTKPKVKADWKELKKRMNDGKDERNMLAHFTAVQDPHGHRWTPDVKLMLDSSVFVPPELKRARKRKYDADGCEALYREFFQLAKDVGAFAKRADWM